MTDSNTRIFIPDSARQEFLYELYLLLFKHDVIDTRVKQRTLESAAETKAMWRIVEISEKAIEHIKEHRNAKSLRRGHRLSRFDRAKYLFERAKPLQKKKMIEYFFAHDTTVLVTQEENNLHGDGHWSPLLPVPDHVFTSCGFAVYVKKSDLEWIDQN